MHGFFHDLPTDLTVLLAIYAGFLMSLAWDRNRFG